MRIPRRRPSRRLPAVAGLVRAVVGGAAVAFWLGAAEPAPGLANGGFEELGADGKPASWHIRDTLTGVSDQAAEGKHALRLEDNGTDVGTDILSEPFPVQGSSLCVVRAKLFLEAGDTAGLGLYLRFWDAQGKDLVEARESQVARPAMTAGQWVDAAAVYRIPPEAVRAAVWLHTFSVSRVTCRVDALQAQLPDADPGQAVFGWAGGTAVPDPAAAGLVVRWAHAESPALTQTFKPPADWSAYGTVFFKLHSAVATGSSFVLIAYSEDPASEGGDYYAFRITLDWTGWRDFEVPFREFGVTRQPVGWQQIDSVVFTAAGWGNTPHPDAVVLLKDFRLSERRRAGPLLDDAEFFAALDLDQPGLEAVKAAVAAADLAKAKAAFAEHLRGRPSPRWRIDWRKHPYRGVTVPPPEADNDPNSWDYYSRFFTVDWTGWKRFTLKKADFAGRTFVEGKGWQGKNPIGWHWIKYLGMNASGWGLTPDPGTVLHFDDIRLVGPAGEATLADFEGEEQSFAGLERVGDLAHAGAWSGRWAGMNVTTSVTCRNLPHDWTGYDELDFWVHSEKATGARFVMILDSDPPKPSAKAEEFLQKRFTYSFAGKPWTADAGDGPIDWHANPTEGPARTHLWNECLHRHFHFRDLSQAYWETGDERYASGMVEQWLDWIRSNPPPLNNSGNGSALTDCSFQTLTTGIRLEGVWPDALYRCLGSPALTDDAVVTIVKSVADQARHLQRWPTGGNWLTEESMGMYTAGLLFPEFRAAGEWRRTAIERLSKQLDEDVYPDGMEVELAAGYNNWVVANFTELLKRADSNGRRAEIPADFQDRLEKMYNYHLYAMMPNGSIPGLNDSGNADVRGALTTAYGLFPKREDFLFAATLGSRGQRPAQISYAFPYSGHYVMRSGWEADAVYALVDAGPYGLGHQHEDKLHLVLYAYGRQLLLDPGNYSYDRSVWRRYVLGTHGHNTVMVDGQGQARAADRATYVLAKPWDTPTPRGDDTLWAAAAGADFVRGHYRHGYGPKGALKVDHQRDVLFVKPAYFLVVDTLTPADAEAHRYDALFHLDAETAGLDEGSLRVTTLWEKEANLAVIPWRRDGLTARVAKGEEDPVQGWANGPWRAVPTAVYTVQGSGPAVMAFVLEPVRPGATPLTREVAVVPAAAGGTVVVTVSQASGTDTVELRPAGTAGAPAKLVRRGADGTITAEWSAEAPTP